MKIFICAIWLCLFSFPLFAEDFLQLVDKGRKTVEFESVEVGATTTETQVIAIKQIKKKRIGAIGFIEDSYKRQLPVYTTYDNPSHYFTVELGVSKMDGSLICIRTCYNTTTDNYTFPEFKAKLYWYLIKE